MTESEIVFCPKCRDYYHFYYENDECVTKTDCKCVTTKLKTKPLDRALQILKEKNNENHFYRTRKSTK